MKTILLETDQLKLTGEIALTGSKSESNRALILAALSAGKVVVENLSEAEDTRTLENVLEQVKNRSNHAPLFVDIGPAGTAMRFLTAFLSIQDGQFELTGSPRMQQRPIGILVHALQQMGAQIAYKKHEGFPPLQIQGQKDLLQHAQIEIDGGVSSQFLSAILLIASDLPQGLHLTIKGELTSKPYLTMTLQMLEDCGIEYTWEDQHIHIKKQSFAESRIYVEPDWSAASYWYSLLALSSSGNIFLKGLKKESLQGDRAIAEWMLPLGVKTTFHQQGVLLEKTEITAKDGNILDLKECPDLAQTLIVCAAALGKNLKFTGLHTLRIKETDRIQALQTELRKFGIQLIADSEDEVFSLDVANKLDPGDDGLTAVQIATYEDHRMAMAFAPLVAHYGEIRIEEPEVVGKSYPDFWNHLSNKGIKITEQ